jgi:hypothetical protein
VRDASKVMTLANDHVGYLQLDIDRLAAGRNAGRRSPRCVAGRARANVGRQCCRRAEACAHYDPWRRIHSLGRRTLCRPSLPLFRWANALARGWTVSLFWALACPSLSKKGSRLNHLGPSRGWCRSEVGARERRSRNQTAITSTDVHNRAFPSKSCLPDFHKASLTSPALNERLIPTIVSFPSNGSFVGESYQNFLHRLPKHRCRSHVQTRDMK